ncbi:MAG: hypothetical protein E7658_05570 [Ruminococcaceae bacterium]|nr:hypothetical protein [Oscillospiraceae bacterium]
MKKTARILTLLLALFCITSCGVPPVEETDTTETAPVSQETIPAEPVVEEDVNPDNIPINSIEGLNEYIYVNLNKSEETAADYRISYRAMDAAEFIELDKELMLDEETSIGCYILGLAKGQYCVKIESGEGENYARKTILDIDVEKQDRSGYAHFKREEGVGGYNNDGTVKDNAIIVYVSNETKNTVTLEVNGTTYTGLVHILQAKQNIEQPMIIRILDKIVTNQWSAKTFVPRFADDSNLYEDLFDNTFSTEFGENLANLPIDLYDRREGKLYRNITTPEGIEAIGTFDDIAFTYLSDGNGQMCYFDDDYTNTIDVSEANDLTIEGIGTKAEFFQFGINFVSCNSVEIRNITFSQYPGDALNWEPYSGNCWIHHNTFNQGYNAWDISIDQDEHMGDGSIDMRYTHNMTIAYNKFVECGKVILISNENRDITLHHNWYYRCIERLPSVTNTNVHSYNNLFDKLGYLCQSVRGNSYYFSEANWFNPLTTRNKTLDDYMEYYMSEPYVKSYKDLYKATSASLTEIATITDDRELVIENNCSPDGVTDYSTFDTNPELFYYDAENKCTDVDVMLDTAVMDIPAALEWVEIHVGAGKNARLDIPAQN